LRRLWNHLQNAQLDLADADRRALDSYRGKKDAETRRNLKAAVAHYQKLVNIHRKTGGLDFALAASLLVKNQLSLGQIGDAVDLDELVSLAEEADAAAPSRGTQSTLISALLARASQALARQEKAYAALVSRAKRSLEPNFLIAVALAQGGDLGQAVRANKDVDRAIDRVRDHLEKFPDEAEPWSWVMVGAGNPEEAAKLARAIRQDEMGKLERFIESKFSNVSASNAFKMHWAAQAAGKEAGDMDCLKKLVKRGVPLPFDPK
jgi:hypothetical protein